jgi:hypothetical protein
MYIGMTEVMKDTSCMLEAIIRMNAVTYMTMNEFRNNMLSCI